MIHECEDPLCSVLTMGRYCVDHDRQTGRAHSSRRPGRLLLLSVLTTAAAAVGGLLLRRV
jgi:hypothetical protein